MSGVPVELIIFLGALGAALLAGWMFIRFVEQRKLSKRIERIKHLKTGQATGVSENILRKRKQQEPQMPWLRILTAAMPKVKSLSNKLERAEMQMSSQMFLMICVTCMGGIFALMTMGLHKSPQVAFGVGIAVGLWLPFKFLNFRINRQSSKFLRYFPDAIDLMVRGLRSGLPLGESMNTAAREVPNPVGGVFALVTSSMKLGVPMEKALQDMAKKLDLTEFNFFVTSITLQRETGGNLAEILNNLSEVLRKRTMMRLKIRAMTSEARASSLIVGALPFFAAGASAVMSPGYLDPLFDDPRGNMALGVAAFMLFGGMWIMRRMAKFEI